MKKNVLYMMAILGMLAVFAIIAGNRRVSRYHMDQIDKVSSSPETQSSSMEPQNKIETVPRTRLRKALPSDYQVDQKYEALLPRTEAQWDYEMRQMMAPTEARELHVNENRFAGYRLSPKKLSRQLTKINRRIFQLEEDLANEPFSEEIRRKLEEIYMLKATLKNLSGLSVIE